MSLNQPPPHDNEHSAHGNGHAERDDRSRPRSASDYWRNCPLLWMKCHSVGAEIVSLRRAVIKETGEKGYPREVGSIRINKAGEITFSGTVTLTEPEMKAMAAEVAAANFPKSEPAPSGSLPPKPKDGDPREYRDYVFRNAAGEVLFVERRFEPKTPGGKKTCLPWSYRDGRWWPEEPDELLPLYGLDQNLKEVSTIFIHEGPKAARKWQEMIAGTLDDVNREALKAHPWGAYMEYAAHVGWAGGAYSAHRTDWSTLPRDANIVIIADNDQPGIEAAKHIAKILAKNGHKWRVSVVRFNDKFPDGFDLADDWPLIAEWGAKEGKYKAGGYKGPSLMDLEAPATWATEMIPVGNKLQPAIRDEFAKEWLCIVDPPVFVNRHQPHILRSEQSFNALVRPFSDARDTASLLRPVLSSQVDGLIYRPGKDLGIVADNGQRKLNIYRPSTIKPKQGDAAPFIAFMEYLIPEEKDRQELMRWCATLIARPEVRMTYGVLLVSETQGVGKSTLGSILAALVGTHNASFPDEKEITGSDFNSWLARKRLAVANEIYAGHNHKAYDRLKSLMTDDVVRVNEKHEKAYELENWIHIFAASNSRRALQIHDQDRRWLIPRVVEEKWPDTKFAEFHAWLADCGLPIVAWWAEHFSRTHAPVLKGEHAPMTAAKQELIDEGRTPGAQLVFDLVEIVIAREERTIIVANDVVAWVRGLRSGDPRTEGSDVLIAALKRAGLAEAPKRFKPHGRAGGASRVFANFVIPPNMAWAELKPFYMAPGAIWPDAAPM